MEVQRRGHQIDERRRSLKFNAGEIRVTAEVTLLEMAANAQPVIGGLQRQVNVLGSLEFENGEASGLRNGEQIEDTVFAAGVGEDLRVNESGVENRIDARDVLAHERFEPALGLRAKKRVTRIACQRIP